MSISDTIFKHPSLYKRVDNPITHKNNNCVLLTTKKERFYVHTFEPAAIYNKLKYELNICSDVLSRFDFTRRTHCCNVISITLYFKGCNEENMIKYLNSIYRTVKNTHKKLTDWVVRLYLDDSVYKCIDEISSIPTENRSNIKNKILYAFNIIKDSENVEIYTFICDTTIESEKTRTYRYLVLSDPEVNICAIREADGFVNNVECHNLKMFANSDKLFYLPPIIASELISYDGKNTTALVGYSYSYWLQLYKYIFQKDYFFHYQNIYDLLAGLFTTKLKIKQDYYYRKISELHEMFNKFQNSTLAEKKATYSDYDLKILLFPTTMPRVYGSLHNLFDTFERSDFFYSLYGALNTGFDEILLLDLFKEVISVSSTKRQDNMFIFEDQYILDKFKSLFYAYNIFKLEYDSSKINTAELLITELKKAGIIDPSYTLTESVDPNNLIEIDAVILRNIKKQEPFCIKVQHRREDQNILDSLNKPYPYDNEKYERYYDEVSSATQSKYLLMNDYKKKYLKYKMKYLLKNKN